MLVFGQMNEPPGRPPARRPLRPDDGRVLPRAGRPGRAALHRQHLPLRPGGLRGLGAARPHALGGRLPADAGDRDGRPAGADHLDRARLGHLDPGGLRAGGRLHRPGAGHGVRPPQRDHRALAGDLRERHLSGGRPARLDLDDPRARRRRRGALPHGDRGPGGPAALQGAPGHHRHPRHRRALRRGQADGRRRARKIERFLSQPFFVAEQFTGRTGEYVPVAETVRGFREILDGEHDDLSEGAFYMQGGIDQVTENAKAAAAARQPRWPASTCSTSRS